MSEILQVKKAEIRIVVDKSLSKSFLEEARKLKNLNPSAVSKKLLKGQYQLYFKLVNKVLFLRTEKRTITIMADLYLMDKLSTMVPINFPALMMEHMTKVSKMAEGKHGLAYSFLLNRMFKYWGVELSSGVIGSIKQYFSHNTLMEYECSTSRQEAKNHLCLIWWIKMKP